MAKKETLFFEINSNFAFVSIVVINLRNLNSRDILSKENPEG